MRTGENVVLRWVDQTDSAAPAAQAAPIGDAADRRSTFWERAAMVTTMFLCFQIALLALFGL